MSGWCLKDNPYPYTYDELPESLTLYRTDHSELINYVPERTTTRNTTRTVYGDKRAVCEVCGFGIGDRRWGHCPKCGARIMEGSNEHD